MREDPYPTHPDDELDPDVRPHMGVTYMAIEGASVPIERPSNKPGGASAVRPSYELDLDWLERGAALNGLRTDDALALIQRLREAESGISYQLAMAHLRASEAELATVKARIAQLEAELSDWRQPNMLTEVEYRERTAKLERVREAAGRVALTTLDLYPPGNWPSLDELRAALAALENS